MKNKIFKFSFKNLILSFIFAGIMLILSLIFLAWNPLEGLDNRITDTMYQKESSATKEIVIVGIDDETIEKYHNYNPIEYRKYFADILNMWAENDCIPAAIGFDVIFNNTYGCDEVDLELAEAMKKHNVILGVNGVSRTEAPYGLSNSVYKGAKKIGFVDALTDNDEAVRRVYLRGDNYDSLSYSIYKMYCENTNQKANTYDIKKAYYFDYYAKPQLNYTPDGKIADVMSNFNYISFGDLIEELSTGFVKRRNLGNDSIVVFGSYASAVDSGLSNDIYNSPIGEMFGVEVQCNVIQSLMNDKLYTEAPVALVIFINVLIIFVVVLLMLCFRLELAIGSFIAGFGMEILITLLSHANKTYYFISLPCIVLILSFVALIIYHYYGEYKHKKEVMGTFKRYISPDVAEALVNKDVDAMSLGGRKRDVACLFVDIRGFTKMSEELEPEAVVDILNGYLEMATNQVFKYGGMVDKFIGDCVMAIFNAPVDLDDYVFMAVCAAYGIVKEGRPICDKVYEKYNKKLEFGVGVHSGSAVIGNIGSKTRMDFTAIGDTVNTASRIEGSASGDQVLISKDVYEIVKDRVKVEDAGDRMFKNKKEPIKCYEVVDIIGYDDINKGGEK